jgi:hypothetical protein
MRKSFKLYSILSVLFVGLLLITSNSCKKDEKDTLPELPPVEALMMDFSFFADNAPQNKSVVISYENFSYSVLNVLTWNSIAISVVALPAAAYAEAFNHEAIYLGENSWQWAYSVTVGEATFTVKLVSKRISNEEYTLKMIVSKSGQNGFENFTWFEGTVRYDGTNATWDLYESPLNTNPVINIEWSMDWEKELYTIKYTYLKTGSDLNGGYIEHGVTENTLFDAYYTISLPAGIISIEWNRTTKAGHVKSPGHFEDSEWHCWDENFLDVTCGNI